MLTGERSVRESVITISLSLFVIGFFIGSVKATTMKALDISQLVAKSDHIVIAKSSSEKSRWDARSRIVTDVTLVVEESLKGRYRAKDELIVTRLGGTIGDLSMRVESAATFPKDKKALVFLREVASLGELRVVGMSQGVIGLDETEGETIVLPAADNSTLVQRENDEGLTSLGKPKSEVWLVRDILGEVRRLVSESNANK